MATGPRCVKEKGAWRCTQPSVRCPVGQGVGGGAGRQCLQRRLRRNRRIHPRRQSRRTPSSRTRTRMQPGPRGAPGSLVPTSLTPPSSQALTQARHARAELEALWGLLLTRVRAPRVEGTSPRRRRILLHFLWSLCGVFGIG